MYCPSLFAEDRPEVLHALMRKSPLATLVTSDSSGPFASHVPMVLHADLGPKGVLRCHVARANGQWKTVESSPAVLAIFQGLNHYITPTWYPTKQEHGKVVPTWNYVAVHVRGRARLFDDPPALLEHLNELTNQQEQVFEKPWGVGDAPPDYIATLSRSIIGIEISIDAIEGKWKVSQNRPERDRQGVVTGLEEIGSEDSLAMAELVKERGRR